jgi:hypothetical protein
MRMVVQPQSEHERQPVERADDRRLMRLVIDAAKCAEQRHEHVTDAGPSSSRSH